MGVLAACQAGEAASALTAAQLKAPGLPRVCSLYEPCPDSDLHSVVPKPVVGGGMNTISGRSHDARFCWAHRCCWQSTDTRHQ